MRNPIFRVALLTMLVAVAVLPARAAQGPAPAFTLDLFNGRTLRLADLKVTAVILLFWTQW